MGLMKLMTSFPYLGSVLVGLAILCPVLAFHPPHRRRIALLSGLMAIPAGLAQGYLSTSYYWTPVRLGGFATGIEDILFSFEAGAACWLAAAWRIRGETGLIHLTRQSAVRYLAVAFSAASLELVARCFGTNPSLGIFGPTLLLGLGVSCLRRDLLPLGVTGAIVFGACYFPLVALWLWGCPGYIHQWNRTQLWGLYPFGVPLEELAWAMTGGFACPLLVAFILDLKWSPSIAEAKPCRTA